MKSSVIRSRKAFRPASTPKKICRKARRRGRSFQAAAIRPAANTTHQAAAKSDAGWNNRIAANGAAASAPNAQREKRSGVKSSATPTRVAPR